MPSSKRPDVEAALREARMDAMGKMLHSCVASLKAYHDGQGGGDMTMMREVDRIWAEAEAKGRKARDEEWLEANEFITLPGTPDTIRLTMECLNRRDAAIRDLGEAKGWREGIEEAAKWLDNQPLRASNGPSMLRALLPKEGEKA